MLRSLALTDVHERPGAHTIEILLRGCESGVSLLRVAPGIGRRRQLMVCRQ